jgi:hypothetical protein
MLRRIGGHFVVDQNDPARVTEVVARALAGQPPPEAPDAESILRDWTADVQFDLLQQRLQSVLARG